MVESTSDAPLPPGNRYLPLLGETLSFLKSPFQFMTDRVAVHGPVFTTHLLGKRAVVFVGGESAGAFADPSLCMREGSMPEHVRELFGGRSIMLLDGEEHVARKRQIMAGFEPRALVSYVPAIQALCEEALARWSALGEFPAIPELKRLAVTVIAKNVISMDAGSDLDALLEAFQTLTAGFAGVPVALPWTAYSKALKSRDAIFAILGRVVKEHRGGTYDDALSRMLAHEAPGVESLTDDNAALELHHIFIAGYIVFGLFASLMTRYAEDPDLRARLEQEIARGLPEGPLTARTVGSLEELGRVVQETKRTTPIVPISFGKAKKTFTVSGFRVPEGTMLCWSPSAHHGDANVYPEPEAFDPGRFSPERAENLRHPHAFAPQGLGPELGHKCSGVDYSTLMAQIFSITLLRGYAVTLPEQDLELDLAKIPPEPVDQLLVSVQPKAVAASADAPPRSTRSVSRLSASPMTVAKPLGRDVLLTLARVMWADGAADAAEARALLAIARSARLGAEDLAAVEKAAREGITETVKLTLVGDDAEHAFALACVIASADGKLDIAERAVLKEVARDLSLDGEALLRAMTAARTIAVSLDASVSALEILSREVSQ